jgi:predicted ATPase
MAAGTTDRISRTLPTRATGFVGRRRELARLEGALDDARLVTVTGVGGVGKTRLAVQVAAQTSDRYPDGVFLVELSPLRDPGLLAATVADRLGLPGEDGRPQLAALLDYLRDRTLLLILDTCEHLVDACATLADAALREAPGVTILATSRQPLDVAGESALLLPPLPVAEPDDDPAADADADADADAVVLFAQRAAAVVDGFTVTDSNRADVISLCRALDGIPLGIELAAVRLRALPLDEMAKHLDDRFRVLTGGKRAGVERHHTLRAAIEWSYELCTPAEQLLWARLSVFAGTFDLAAAEEVCAGGELTRAEIVETLVGLVEKSVLVRQADTTAGAPTPGAAALEDAVTGRTEYRLLDTLRQFGADHLAGTNAEAVAQSRLVAHYLAMAQQWGRDPMRDQLAQYRGLRREHANLRAAMEYALGLPGNDSAAVAIATSLAMYWRLSGQLREGEYWLNRVLEHCPRPSPARARVLGTRGYVTTLLGDLRAAHADAEAALEMAAQFGDMDACGRACVTLHRTLTWGGNPVESEEMAGAALSFLGSAGDTFGLAQLDIQAAVMYLQAGRPDLVIERCAEGLARLPADEHWATGLLSAGQGLGHLLRGELDAGTIAAHRGLALEYELGDLGGTAYVLGTLAFLAAAQHRYERTAWLIGGSAPLWERVGPWYTGAPAIVTLHRLAEQAAQNSLGEERYWQLRERAAAAPLEVITRLALADADHLPDDHPASEALPRGRPGRPRTGSDPLDDGGRAWRAPPIATG